MRLERGSPGLNRAVAATVALNVMGTSLIAPVLPSLGDYYGVGIGTIALLISVFALARLTVRFAGGALSDKFGSRAIGSIGGWLQAVGALGASFLPGFGLLIALMFLQGIGAALFGTSANRFLLVVNPREKLGRAVAIFQSGIIIGTLIGPLVGGFSAEAWGVAAPYFVQAFSATALALLTLRVMRGDTVSQSRSVRRATANLWSMPLFRVVMLMGFALFFMRAGLFNVVVPAFGDSVLAMSPGEIGVAVSAAALASLAAMSFAGRFADRRGRRPLAVFGMVSSAAAVLLYLAVEGQAGLVLVTALVGLGVGFVAVALPTIVGDIAEPGAEGVASGLFRIANDLGWIVGPLVLGVFAGADRYNGAFLLAAALLGFTVVVFQLVTRRRVPALS